MDVEASNESPTVMLDIMVVQPSTISVPVLPFPIGTKITDRFWPEEDVEHSDRYDALWHGGPASPVNVLTPPPYHRRSRSADAPSIIYFFVGTCAPICTTFEVDLGMKPQSVHPTRASNLQATWGYGFVTVLPAGNYVWTIKKPTPDTHKFHPLPMPGRQIFKPRCQCQLLSTKHNVVTRWPYWAPA
ncbi:hypothetical protein M405DRAFT_846015 [Rhizopogon salebrosus TDB-379]|nr:hypothetical protein M405DRAFT_846015 [Rhizopogon salebrosus TDB-379]